MHLKDLVIGSIEAIYALILGIVVIFISYKIFLKITPNIDEEKEISENKNIALSIVLTSIIITVGMIVKNILYPSITSIKLFWAKGEFALLSIIQFCSFQLCYFALSILFAIASVSLAAYLFSKMTIAIDEMNEIKNNNIAVGILLAGLIFTIGYFINESVSAMMKNLIPYDFVSNIKQMS